MLGKSARIHHREAGNAVARSSLILIVCLCLLSFAHPSHSAVVWSGDLDPADPTTWTSSTAGYIGKTSSGTLDITAGSDIVAALGQIGFESGSTGEVTVDGTGSTWTNDALYVGNSGSGTLNIINGGAVTVEVDFQGTAHLATWVARSPGSLGTIHFDNGTLTTDELFCAVDDLTGTGTINTHGLISDVDLVFDTTHSLSQTFNINSNPGQNITVNLDLDGAHSVGAGYDGVGTMKISDGIIIESTGGYIGYKSGSTGQVTVDGIGSTWTNGILSVGENGSGTLNITGGGAVNNRGSYIGIHSSSTGEVTVDGAGSAWTTDKRLYVGYNGSGTLNITDGGLVRVAETLTIDNNGDGDSFINMATGGMLAITGDADDSLVEFLGLVEGTDAIRYWDYSISDWADITGATYDDDYTLSYLTEGDLAGYTVLTASVPAPTVAGDANHDGVVDAVDAAVLAKYWQTESGAFWGMGDFNGDGVVNDLDATLLAANWTSSANAAVPEPAGVALLWAVVVAGLGFSSRRRKG